MVNDVKVMYSKDKKRKVEVSFIRFCFIDSKEAKVEIISMEKKDRNILDELVSIYLKEGWGTLTIEDVLKKCTDIDLHINNATGYVHYRSGSSKVTFVMIKGFVALKFSLPIDLSIQTCLELSKTNIFSYCGDVSIHSYNDRFIEKPTVLRTDKCTYFIPDDLLSVINTSEYIIQSNFLDTYSLLKFSDKQEALIAKTKLIDKIPIVYLNELTVDGNYKAYFLIGNKKDERFEKGYAFVSSSVEELADSVLQELNEWYKKERNQKMWSMNMMLLSNLFK